MDFPRHIEKGLFELTMHIDEEKLAEAEKLLQTYYLEQIIELSNLTEEQALAILMSWSDFDLPEVIPL